LLLTVSPIYLTDILLIPRPTEGRRLSWKTDIDDADVTYIRPGKAIAQPSLTPVTKKISPLQSRKGAPFLVL